MAVALKAGIRDLILELLAHAAVFLRPGQAARTVPAGALQSLPDGVHHLPVLVEPNLHGAPPF